MYSEHIHSSTQLQVLPCQSLTWISINLGGHLSAYAKNHKTKQSKTEAGNGRSHVFKGWCEATTHEDQSYRHSFAGQSAHQTTVTLTVTLESLNLGSSRLSPSPGNPLRATRKIGSKHQQLLSRVQKKRWRFSHLPGWRPEKQGWRLWTDRHLEFEKGTERYPLRSVEIILKEAIFGALEFSSS